MTTDTIPPTITINSDKNSLKAGENARIVFTLSEPSTDFVLSDISLSGGTLSNFSGSGTNYTAIFTPAENSTGVGSIHVANFKFSDAAANANEDGADADNRVLLAIDTIPPTISISSSKIYLGLNEVPTIKFILSEPSTDFNISDIYVSGGVLSAFEGSGTSYTAAFTPTSTSNLEIFIQSYKFSDAAGNFNSTYSERIRLFSYDPLRANVEWTRLFDPYFEVTEVTTSSDGSIYVAGYLRLNSNDQTNGGGSEAYITKYNADGTKDWTRVQGTSSLAPDGWGGVDDSITALATNPEGSIYVAGFTSGNLDGQTSAGSVDAIISKYSADGSKAWTRLIGSNNQDHATGVTVGVDGSIYVAGSTGGNLDGQLNAGPGYTDVFVSKYNADGNEEWTRLVGGSSLHDTALALAAGADGSIYVAGYTNGNLDGQSNAGYLDAFVTKYHPDGSKSWTHLIGSALEERAYALVVGADGSIYIAGSTGGNLDGQINAGREDAFVSKLNPDGSRAWTRLLGSSSGDYATSIIMGVDGAIYTAGMTGGSNDGKTYAGITDTFVSYGQNYYGSGTGDIFVTKLDDNGDIEWIRLFGTSLTEWVTGLAASPDGSLYLVGSTEGNLDGQINAMKDASFLMKLTLPDASLPRISIGSNKMSLSSGESATIRFVLSKPSINFSLSDITVLGGTLSNFQGSGTIYTAIFTSALEVSGATSISVGSGKFSDAQGQFNDDGAEADNTISFNIVKPTYDLVAASISVNEGATAAFSISSTNPVTGLSLPYTITGVSTDDIIGGMLTGAVTLDAAGNASIIISIAADNKTEGDETLTLTMQDQLASITIKDTSVNISPVASSAADTTYEDTTLNGVLPRATDANGDIITYAKASNPSHGSVAVNASGTYFYIPSANYNGADSFTFTVSDGKGGSNTYTQSLTITAVNDAPVLASALLDQTATSSSAFSVTVSASAFTDIDNASLTYTATQGNGLALPAWLSFNGGTRTFSGIPPAGDSSAFVAKVIASDGASSASDTFVISTGNAIGDDWLFLATIGNAWFNQTFGKQTMIALQAEVDNFAQGDPVKFAGLVYEIFFGQEKLADIAAGFANNLGLLSSTAFVNEVASRLNTASSGYERGVALYQVTQEFVAGTLGDAALSRNFGVELDYALVFATINGTVNTHTNPDGSPIELPAPTGEQRFSGLSARENEFDGGGSDTAPSIFEGEVFIDVVGIGGPTLLL